MVGMGRELPRRGALDEEPGRLRLGLNVVVVCLRVDPPWGGTPIALPLNLRIRAKKNGKKTTELAAEMVAEIAGWLPDRRFHLTGDGACATLAGAGQPRTHVTSRLRRDAALYAPAPPRTGRRGRPRTRGARLGRPPELAAAAAANDWQQVTADMRGREAARLVAVFGRALVPGPQGRPGPPGHRPRPFRHRARRLLRHHRPVRHRSPDRHPLRRPLAHRVLLQRGQAARRGRAPPDLEAQRSGPCTPARPPRASWTPSPRCAATCGTSELPACRPARRSPAKYSARCSTRSQRLHRSTSGVRNFTVDRAGNPRHI